MEKLTISEVKQIFGEIKKVIDDNKEFLIKLDAAMGDGDLGLTMTAGFDAIVKEIKNTSDNDMGNVIAKMGMVMSNVAPSTLGTLLATAMMRAGKIVKGYAEIGLKEIVDMGNAAINGIKQRGKSEVGDKTILDSLYPAIVELDKAVKDNLTLDVAFEKAFKAAKEGFKKTESMVSKHGRAAYYGEKSIGHPDSGAAVGMLIFEGIYNFFSKNK
ncbi:MAG TPA: dihydroxyacetone kinase subunit L [Thermoanaerobacterales bacterium]|nr:dihydroxyacetone kinase subunit L [Thermoanaerobacterales bacterium]